jgi:hypothetical protein
VLNVQTNLMKPPTVDMLRTYLMTASLAFVFIVTLAPAALAVFGTSDEIFQTPALRDGAIAAAIYLVLLTKTAAKLAFHTASTNRHTPPLSAHCVTAVQIQRLELGILQAGASSEKQYDP